MSLTTHVAFFLVISFITALVSAANRLPTLRQIIRDTIHFFVTITVFVFAFCVVVYVLEWIFIRPLL